NDPLALELADRQLTRAGFRVVTAASGEEGLRLARTERPDVITLDVDMPGMDGWTVLTMLKADPQLAAIPVGMVTMIDERVKGHALGAVAFLVKPVRRSDLVAVLNRVHRSRGAGTALVVEDDASNREVLVRMLQKDGWTVHEASDGLGALEAIGQQTLD